MKKHRMLFPFERISDVMLTVLFLAAVLALGTDARADDPAVIRLSFVDGDVQISQGNNAASAAQQIDHAVANMPLFEGSVITTAADGQAEIEFADGSVARLTPNSSLGLTHLQRLGPTGHTDITLQSGLAYFELNVGQGQHFSVRMGLSPASTPASIAVRPIENSVFRISLDTMPETAVMQGSIHAEGTGVDTDINAGQDFRLNPSDPSQSAVTQDIQPESWDQWNMDRDAAIAQQSASQTAVRDDSQAPEDPGWNDLDYYGNWYPVEGYGNVWTPGDVDADWDPFGYGYWGDFSGYGTTWISGYPWGWLPYHCGAWNYFPFGWGWVPGGCGLGWSPIVTVWNTPPNYRLPVWPRGGIIVPSQQRHAVVNRLILVDRGAAARGPWAPGSTGLGILRSRGMQVGATHGQPLQMDGNIVQPVPLVATAISAPLATENSNSAVTRPGSAVGSIPVHVGVPVRTIAPGFGGLHNNVERSIGVPANSGGALRPIGRPSYSPPAASHAAPAAPAPHVSSPSPAPAPPAHH